MEKPDFKKAANEYTGYSPDDRQDHFKAGCEHVWNTHVVPLQEENKIMFENGGKLTAKVLQLESDNKLLREENTKCKDLAWEAANEISRLNKEIERLKEQAEKLSFTKCDYCGYEKDLDV